MHCRFASTDSLKLRPRAILAPETRVGLYGQLWLLNQGTKRLVNVRQIIGMHI